MSSIYYMLTKEEPIGHMHKNKSDILHFYHCGSPVKYFVITADGKLEETILGHNFKEGH